MKRLLARLAAFLAARARLRSGRLPLEFRTGRAAGGAPAVTAGGGAGTIRVRGSYPAGICHRSEQRTARRAADGAVVLRIELSGRRRGPCPDLLTVTAYEALIGGLPAGTHRLRVEHAGTLDAGVRLDQRVTVR